MRRKHPHHHHEDLHIFLIPSDVQLRMELKVILNNSESMAHEVQARHVRVINDESLPALDCGCPMALITSESQEVSEGELNTRASCFFSDTFIYGDAFLIGVGQAVIGSNGLTDVDFISLTPEFNEWEGPGHPLPPSRMPWN